MYFANTQFGFDWGAAKVERACSDEKQGWVMLQVTTPKGRVDMYVTRTGKIRVYEQKKGNTVRELK